MTPNEVPTNVELQADVTAALRTASAVDSVLAVSAHEGVVTLSGSVTDAAERSAAQAAARQVPGVTVVSDEISARYGSVRRHRAERAPIAFPVGR